MAVDFIEAGIDRPVIVGQLYNGQDTLGLDQGGINQWVVDDASSQLRMRLLAGYTAAELGLGHLIQQSAGSARRGPWRGSGFEATTQGWVSVRAVNGLLVSTTARAGTRGSARPTQM